ncbi:MAG: DUF4364 family protein [Ruminococcaceae bacterium]|nr:DUF4364 family protein [Oscillospiraceae bacterium]
MGSQIGSMNNVKIFVLYLMKNINYPMDYVTVNDVVMQTDYVMYLDFADAFHQMLEGGLIRRDGTNDHGDPLYSVTREGCLVAEQLKCDLLPSILDQSLACALQYLDFRRRGVTVECQSQRMADQTFDVTVTLKEKDKVILKTTVNADSEYHATQMKRHFRERPEVIYRGILALLTGQVGFLFDEKRSTDQSL